MIASNMHFIYQMSKDRLGIVKAKSNMEGRVSHSINVMTSGSRNRHFVLIFK